MKWLITTIISILSIIATFTVFYLGYDKPDLVYTVSDNIPLNTSENRGNNIQQIEVKNIGNKSAKDVQIKIKGDIIDSKIIKDSELDTYKIYSDVFELVYSKLPPEGSFKLVVESPLNGLDDSVLTIKSENGLARNGLENENNTLIENIIIIGFPLFYLILAFFSYRDLKLSSIVRKLAFRPTEQLNYIYRNKPFYFKVNDWKDLLEKFITEKIREDLNTNFYTNVESLNSYHILKAEKPQYLTEVDWNNIKESANKTLKLKIEQIISKEYSEDTLLQFLASISDVKRNFPESFYLEITKKISSSYIRRKINDHYYTTEIINKALTEPKPSFVINDDWEKYTRHLSNIQYMSILDDMFKIINEPLNLYNKYKENIANKNNKDSIKNLAYKIQINRFLSNNFKYLGKEIIKLQEKPDWMETDDYQKISKVVNEINSIKKNNDINIEQQNIIKNALSEHKLPDERPSHMKEYNWEILIKFVKESKELQKLKESLTKKEEFLNNQTNETNIIKEKINRQLSIVHTFLSDPSVLDRIESYNNVFAEGNLENLTKLSKYLRENGITMPKEKSRSNFHS